MTDKEFMHEKRNAKSIPFSPFAKFMIDGIGYKYAKANGDHLDKYEVFESGYTNVKNIIAGNTKIVAIQKRTLQEINIKKEELINCEI